MHFSSIVAVFVSGLAMVQAAPAVEVRQVAAACPSGAPNHMSSDPDNFWSNICCAYNVDQVCAILSLDILCVCNKQANRMCL